MQERRKENKLWHEDLQAHREEENTRTQEILKAIAHLETKSMTSEEKTYITLAMKREARRETFQTAVIQKTTISLIWAMIVGFGYLFWEVLKNHLQSLLK